MAGQADLLEGLNREQYLRQQVKMDGVCALEEDWRELLHWIAAVSRNVYFYNLRAQKVENWGKFWENQLLLILTEIALLDTDALEEQFLLNKGTEKEKETLRELQQFILNILLRLKQCQYNLLVNGNSGGELENIITGLMESLEKTVEGIDKHGMLKVTEEATTNSLIFFQTLDTVNLIRAHFDKYLERIDQCGEVEPTLSVLYIFLRNYVGRSSVFNQSVGYLPVFYLKEILKSRSRQALPDHTWITLNKTPGIGSVIVPEGTAFVGEDLSYLSTEQIVVTDLQIEGLYSVLLERGQSLPFQFEESRKWVTGIHRQGIPLLASEDGTDLFGNEGSDIGEVPVGWLMESPMFDLREGNREVELEWVLSASSITFLLELLDRLCQGSDDPEQLIAKIFDDALLIKVSGEEGWWETSACHTVWEQEQGRLVVRFPITEEQPESVICSEEIHGINTRYPAIQLVLNPDAWLFAYSWASGVTFEKLTVKVEVKGITELKIYNEYGELDPSVPFYPFGVQAKKGAWFVFGNYEMACKPLKRVVLAYKWQQLPTEAGGFAEHYKGYTVQPPINNRSFDVYTQLLKERKWISPVAPVCLFQAEGEDTPVDENGSVTFSLSGEMPVVSVPEENYSLGKVRSGFLRVMLSAPGIGFGSDYYRQLFTQIMLGNSRKKGYDADTFPAEPITPMMNDVVLSYEAEETFSLKSDIQTGGIRFYQLKPLAWESFLPVVPKASLPLADPVTDAAHLLFAFRNALDCSLIRIYFDITMRRDETGFYDGIWEDIKLNWYYNDGDCWQLLPSDQVLQEETRAFTRAGLVELTFPDPISASCLDEEGYCWLQASIQGNYKECRLVRGVYVNVVEVIAEGGNGTSLPCGTISEPAIPIPGIESVSQVVSGFGGCPPEDEEYLSLRIAQRIAHRARAVSPVDFERMALEQFPVLEKVKCITRTEAVEMTVEKPLTGKIRLVAMSHEQGGKYPLCSLVTLQDIQKYLSGKVSSFVELDVVNPVYEKIRVHCRIKLHSTESVGGALRTLQRKINFYIAPWLSMNQMPELNKGMSLQGLYTILVNDASVSELQSLWVERMDEQDQEKRYYELKMDSVTFKVVEEVFMMESVCGGVFVPDENHKIEF